MSGIIMITVTTRNDVVVISVGNNEGHLYDNQIVI